MYFTLSLKLRFPEQQPNFSHVINSTRRYQPRPQALMCYRVSEGGLEPNAIARGLAKNGKFIPDQGVFIPDFAEGKLALL